MSIIASTGNQQYGQSQSPFDSIKHIDEEGREYWLARDLMNLLNYTKWQRFQDAIERARTSLQNSGGNPDEHFTHLPGAVSGNGRFGDNYKLSRYSCYLISLNGDPRKPEIAQAQHYFVVKTREAETLQFKPMSQVEVLQVAVNQLVEQERRTQELERQQQQTVVQVAVIEQRLDGFNSADTGYHTVKAYCRLNKIKFPLNQASSVGKIAVRICRERGVTIGKIADEAYGFVNSYPAEILQEAIAQLD
jgi:DNA-damage-inducible protein D